VYDMGPEIRKRLNNPADAGWNNPIFLQIIRDILGDEWREVQQAPFGKAFTKDEAFIGNGAFYSNKVYWTQDENKLKGIIYRNR